MIAFKLYEMKMIINAENCIKIAQSDRALIRDEAIGKRIELRRNTTGDSKQIK